MLFPNKDEGRYIVVEAALILKKKQNALMRIIHFSFIAHGRPFLSKCVYIIVTIFKTTQGRCNQLRDNNIFYVLTSREKGARLFKSIILS
jgi:hypothetical protein